MPNSFSTSLRKRLYNALSAGNSGESTAPPTSCGSLGIPAQRNPATYQPTQGVMLADVPPRKGDDGSTFHTGQWWSNHFQSLIEDETSTGVPLADEELIYGVTPVHARSKSHSVPTQYGGLADDSSPTMPEDLIMTDLDLLDLPLDYQLGYPPASEPSPNHPKKALGRRTTTRQERRANYWHRVTKCQQRLAETIPESITAHQVNDSKTILDRTNIMATDPHTPSDEDLETPPTNRNLFELDVSPVDRNLSSTGTDQHRYPTPTSIRVESGLLTLEAATSGQNGELLKKEESPDISAGSPTPSRGQHHPHQSVISARPRRSPHRRPEPTRCEPGDLPVQREADYSCGSRTDGTKGYPWISGSLAVEGKITSPSSSAVSARVVEPMTTTEAMNSGGYNMLQLALCHQALKITLDTIATWATVLQGSYAYRTRPNLRGRLKSGCSS